MSNEPIDIHAIAADRLRRALEAGGPKPRFTPAWADIEYAKTDQLRARNLVLELCDTMMRENEVSPFWNYANEARP